MLVARKHNLDHSYPPKMPVPQKRQEVKTVLNKSLHIKAKVVLATVFVFIVLSFLIAQYCYYVALSLEIDKVQSQIAQIEEEKSHLEIEVRQLSSLERIESIALDELGLKYPKEQQWLVLTSR